MWRPDRKLLGGHSWHRLLSLWMKNPAGQGTQEEPACWEFWGTSAQARQEEATPSRALLTLMEYTFTMSST